MNTAVHTSCRAFIDSIIGRSSVSAVARAPVTPGSVDSIVTGTSRPAAIIARIGRPESASIVAPVFGIASSPSPGADT